MNSMTVAESQSFGALRTQLPIVLSTTHVSFISTPSLTQLSFILQTFSPSKLQTISQKRSEWCPRHIVSSPLDLHLLNDFSHFYANIQKLSIKSPVPLFSYQPEQSGFFYYCSLQLYLIRQVSGYWYAYRTASFNLDLDMVCRSFFFAISKLCLALANSLRDIFPCHLFIQVILTIP